MNIFETLKNLYNRYEYVIDEDRNIIAIYDLYQNVKNDIMSQDIPEYFTKKYTFLDLQVGKEYDFRNHKYIALPTNKGTMILQDAELWKKNKESMKLKFDDSNIKYVSSRYPTIINNIHIDEEFDEVLGYLHMKLNPDNDPDY